MRKVFVLVLALIMVLAMVPTVAMAADTTLTVGSGYATIQDAVNAVGAGTTEIILPVGTYNETVQILQQTGKNIIITGQAGAVFKGNFIVDGDGRSSGTDTLTIRNLNFDKSGTTLSVHEMMIDLKKFVSPSYGYAHNVTIEDCSFVGDDSGEYTFGINAGSSGGNTAFNTVIRNCTFTHVDCAIQARCTGITFENVTVTDAYSGINAQNSSNITLTNVKIEAIEYALRLGPGASAGVVNITNSRLSSSTIADDLGAIVFRSGTTGNVTITGSDILGNVRCLSSPDVILNTDDVFWGGTRTGFVSSQLNIQNNVLSPHFSSSTVVTAGVEPAFIVVIPSAVNLGTLQKGAAATPQDFDVKAQGVIVEAGKEISVSVTSDFKLASGSAEIVYQLLSGTSVMATGSEFAAFDTDGTQEGQVKVPDTTGISVAGSYQDTMTFTIAYQDK
jgi:hypothetical protein